jgi:uncharacterized protein with PIN domain
MAKLIYEPIQIIEVVIKVDDNHQLVLCRQCDSEVVLRSVITAALVDDPLAISITHNLFCPSCKKIGFISLSSKVS